MFDKKQHRIDREQFYKQIADFWPNLDGEEYALFDIYEMSEGEIDAIREATEKVGKIYIKTAGLLRNLDDETLEQLDFPQKIIPFLRTKNLSAETVIARVDFVQTARGLKVLEVNSDTPTFEKEVFHVNGLVSKHFGLRDPNEGFERDLAETIHTTVLKSMRSVGKFDDSNIVFTSHDDHEEDRLTTKYLMEISSLDAKYVPLHKLQYWEEDGSRFLLDDEGIPIDVLYRQTYPLEHLIEDKNPTSGEHVGLGLLNMFHDQSVICFNPLSAFLLQSKAVQTIIWGLHEEGSNYFSTEEHDWIEEYFLPTYLEADPFLAQSKPYVKKPSFGREGDTVEVFDGNGKLMKEDKNKTYQSSLPVYQEYVSLPTTTIKTNKGMTESHLLIGSFLVKGKASAIGLRAGNQITDNNAYFLPMGLR